MTRFKFVLSVAIVSLLLSGTMAIGSAYIGSGDIINGGVHEADIGKMAVTKTKIKTGAVNKYKIATGAVNTYKILNGTIRPVDLSAEAKAGMKGDKGDRGPAGADGGSQTVTEYLAIDGAHFAPVPHKHGHGAGLFTTDTFLTPLVAVDLPNGAVVKKLEARVQDNLTDSDIGVSLNRSGDAITSVRTTGYSIPWQTLADTSISNPVIDKLNHTYSLEVDFEGRYQTLKLDWLRITYEMTN